MAELAPGIPDEPVRDLLAWLRKSKVRGFLIGGLAASLLGRPRYTRDVDALVFIDEKKWAAFLDQGRAFSFIPRIDDPVAYAHRVRVFLLRHEKSSLDFDLIVAGIPFEEEILSRVRKIKVGRSAYPVPTPEDFIILKAIANRPKDQIDIQGVLDRWPDLDLERVLRCLTEFSLALETPEILTEFQTALLRRGKPKRRRKK